MAVDKILQDVLALPREDRARLMDAIADSLEPDEEWETAWAAEVERRVRDLDEGRATTISHEEFKRRVRARLSQP